MKILSKLFTALFFFIAFTYSMSGQIINAKYSRTIKDIGFSRLSIEGKLEDTTFCTVYQFPKRSSDKPEGYYPLYMEGDIPVKLEQSIYNRLYLSKGEEDRRLSDRIYILKNKIIQLGRIGKYGSLSDTIIMHTIDPITLKTNDDEPVIIDIIDLEDKQKNINYRYIISDDTSSIVILNYEMYSKYNTRKELKSNKYKINASVFDINSFELKHETTIETDVDDNLYSISKITLTNSNDLIIGFKRNDYTLSDEVSFKEKFDVSGLGIDDYILYSGNLKSNQFERNGIECYRPLRKIIDKRIIVENDNILLFNLFLDSVKVNSKNYLQIPGYEIITLNKSELDEINRTEIKSTLFQVNMCVPSEKNLLKASNFLSFTLSKLRFSKIKKLPNGNWLLTSEIPFFNLLKDDITFYCNVIGSLSQTKTEKSWLRIIPNSKHGSYRILGIESKILTYNNDIYFITNEHPANIESLKYNESILNTGHLMGDSIPGKNTYKKICLYMTTADNVLRIDKLTESGNVSHTFVNTVRKEDKYLPVPINSWITDEGILYVHGLIDYQYDWNLYESCDFMMIDLNAIK